MSASSFGIHVGRRVRQVEVIVDVVGDFVRDVDRGIVDVEFLIEGLNIELLPRVLDLFDLVAVFILRVLLVSKLLGLFVLGSLVLLQSATNPH